MNIFDHYRQRYEAAKDEEFTLQEFLTIARQDRSAYVNAAERLLMAIGEPVMVDTALEPRLSRLFSNRVVARYPAFEEFYGISNMPLRAWKRRNRSSIYSAQSAAVNHPWLKD
jgi:serine protein kinase